MLTKVYSDQATLHAHASVFEVAKLAFQTTPAMVASMFSFLGLLRSAFFVWANLRDSVCFELGQNKMALGLYDIGTPFLLMALSTIALCWLQFVRGEGGKRQTGLEGVCLTAFVVWNGVYAVFRCASTVALDVLPPGLGKKVAQATLAYEAATFAVQGVAYIFFGGRLLQRLKRMTGSKTDGRVDQFRRRVRRLLVCAGVGCLALAGCLIITAFLPPRTRNLFFVQTVLQRAIETFLVFTATAFGLRTSASGQSSLYFPRMARWRGKLSGSFTNSLFASSRNSTVPKAVELGSIYRESEGDVPEVFSPMGRNRLRGWEASPSVSMSERMEKAAASMSERTSSFVEESIVHARQVVRRQSTGAEELPARVESGRRSSVV